ncbi:MAG: response regulator [Roseobacter sp.]
MLETGPVLDIFVVEDNDDEFEATERALRQNDGPGRCIKRCCDGHDAWEYLTGNVHYAATHNAALPALVLLVLNMPGLDGRRLLARMKDNEDLSALPVVVMTTSTAPEDILACYRAGTNTYVKKPVSWSEFSHAVERLHEYWFEIALLPK